ncbi:hypothetical protein HDK77DRAFT_311917 [Phyllosticta capitalensis]
MMRRNGGPLPLYLDHQDAILLSEIYAPLPSNTRLSNKMEMNKGPAISIIIALVAIFLGVKVLGAPTGEEPQNAHLEARNAPESGLAQDKQPLEPRDAIPNADANPQLPPECNVPDLVAVTLKGRFKRDANPDPEALAEALAEAAWSHPSCGIGHRRKMEKRDAASNPDPFVEEALLERRAAHPNTVDLGFLSLFECAVAAVSEKFKRDANPNPEAMAEALLEARWSGPSCRGVGHKAKKRDAEPDADPVEEEAKGIEEHLVEHLFARTPPSNSRPARKMRARIVERDG